MPTSNEAQQAHPELTHSRTIGWIGTTALAMGGSNQSLFLLGALFAAQGTAAVPLLIVALVTGWSHPMRFSRSPNARGS